MPKRRRQPCPRSPFDSGSPLERRRPQIQAARHPPRKESSRKLIFYQFPFVNFHFSLYSTPAPPDSRVGPSNRKEHPRRSFTIKLTRIKQLQVREDFPGGLNFFLAESGEYQDRSDLSDSSFSLHRAGALKVDTFSLRYIPQILEVVDSLPSFLFPGSFCLPIDINIDKMQGLGGSHRQAYDQNNLPIEVKNKFVNFLFVNRQLQEVTFHKTTICFFSVFAIFLGLSIFLFAEVGKVKEIGLEYYNPGVSSCELQNICNFTLTIGEEMQAPIYLMYYLGNFYQNEKRYIQSKNNYQLAGNPVDFGEARTCYPYITNFDMNKTTSWDSSANLTSSNVASPCGAIAFSFPYFNDKYKLYSPNNTEIYIDETDISWPNDKGQYFRREINSSLMQWSDVEDQHFIVWMRTSGLPNFKKPWGKISTNLVPGNYTITAQNSLNITGWGGKRGVILTTKSSVVGTKNFLLPTSFLIIAVLSCVAAIFFCFRFRALRDIGKLKM